MFVGFGRMVWDGKGGQGRGLLLSRRSGAGGTPEKGGVCRKFERMKGCCRLECIECKNHQPHVPDIGAF